MPPPPATVFLVDDDRSFLSAVSRLLRAGGYTVQIFSSATEFLQSARADTPGCVLLDLHMPGPSGLDLQDALAKTQNPWPIIFLTGQGDIPSSVQAMRGGAEDFLTKPVRKVILFAAIERALARDRRERQQRARRRELRALYATLTPREREVMALVISGKLNKQIAADLGTVERTVKAHRAQVMQKMKVTSLADLVRAAGELSGGAELSSNP